MRALLRKLRRFPLLVVVTVYAQIAWMGTDLRGLWADLRGLFRKLCRFHLPLLVIMYALIAWGVWAIYNASSFREGMHLSTLWRVHAVNAALGTGVFVVVSVIDYRWMRWGAWVIYLGGLASVLAPYLLGRPHYHSYGAISFLGYPVRTATTATGATCLGLVLVLGWPYLVAPMFRRPWLRILVAAGMAAISMLLLVRQWDTGAAWVVGIVTIIMLLVAGIPWRYLTVLFAIGLCLMPLWYHFGLKPYQKKRVDVAIEMMTDLSLKALPKDYMSNKLQLAVGSAGYYGKGPLSEKVEGRSVHRTFFTPTEAINEFIFAVIVEEFGFMGGLFQIVITAVLLLLCVHVAFKARDELGRMMVVGVVALCTVCSLQHMAMNVCVSPISRQPMPFVSFGHTELAMYMFMMGLVQSVWIHRKGEVESAAATPAESAEENAPPPSQQEKLSRLDG